MFQYPPPETLERRDGLIMHPTYGVYSETIPYEEGMTLMPGQATELTVELPSRRE